MANNKSKPKPKGHPTNMWDAIRDITVAAIAKGQLLPMGLFAIVILIVVRMPSTEVGTLAFRLLDGIEKGWILGYLLGFISSIGWFIHAKWQRSVISGEFDRMGREKSQLQKESMGSKIKGSTK